MLPTGSQRHRFSNLYVERKPIEILNFFFFFGRRGVGFGFRRTLTFHWLEIQCDSRDALERARTTTGRSLPAATRTVPRGSVLLCSGRGIVVSEKRQRGTGELRSLPRHAVIFGQISEEEEDDSEASGTAI